MADATTPGEGITHEHAEQLRLTGLVTQLVDMLGTLHRRESHRFEFLAEWHGDEDERLWPCTIVADAFRPMLRIYAFAPDPLPMDRKAEVLEFVADANHGLPLGCFELDPASGMLRFRVSAYAEFIRNVNDVDNLLQEALGAMCDGEPAIRKVATGEEDPASAMIDILVGLHGPGDDVDPPVFGRGGVRRVVAVGGEVKSRSTTSGTLPRTHRLNGTRIWVGEHPLMHGADAGRSALARVLDAGVTCFLALSDDAELPSYASALDDVASWHHSPGRLERASLPVQPDSQVKDAMGRALNALEQLHREGQGVYVHARGFDDRLAAFIACHRIRSGWTVEEALAELDAIWEAVEHTDGTPIQPLSGEWRGVVMRWTEGERIRLLNPKPRLPAFLRDRMRGALVGLAVGDALGAAVEFRKPGTFPPVTRMTGGGPNGLKPGQWTDDTSMALCLAESLIERRTLDPRDQMERYLRWRKEGHLSSTGECFDCGATVGAALDRFEQTGEPFSGSKDPRKAGNGSLMRLAPVPLFFFGRQDDPIERCAESSRTTHGAVVAVDACRYLGALIVGALDGATKHELLSGCDAPTAGYWDENPLDEAIAAVANGSFRRKSPPEIRGTGYAAAALEAALWAFYHGRDFREGCLLAVNLGDDADTTGAIYGQLAGAYYGESGIPPEWRGILAHKRLIDRYAELLFQLSFDHRSELSEERKREVQSLVEAALRDHGSPERAVREIERAEAEAKKEMGVVAYYMSGSMGAAGARGEALMQLRVRLALDTLGG